MKYLVFILASTTKIMAESNTAMTSLLRKRARLSIRHIQIEVRTLHSLKFKSFTRSWRIS